VGASNNLFWRRLNALGPFTALTAAKRSSQTAAKFVINASLVFYYLAGQWRVAQRGIKKNKRRGKREREREIKLYINVMSGSCRLGINSYKKEQSQTTAVKEDEA
jgi:hypothetical protein